MGRRRVVTGILLGLGVALFALLLWTSAYVHELYDQDPFWLVAPYAEPFRTLTGLLLCAGACLLVWHRRQVSRSAPRRLAVTLAAFGLTLATMLELCSAVYYDQVNGQLLVATPLGLRAEIDLRSTEDGICVEAELNGQFVWQINGSTFVPAVLPLPRRDTELKAALRRPAPKACWKPAEP